MVSGFIRGAALCLTVTLVFAHKGYAQLPIRPTRFVTFKVSEGSYMNVDVSPDGKTLAFDLLGNLYTLPVTGGSASQITTGLALDSRPVWSPDGSKLAYISDGSGDYGLQIRSLDGRYNRSFRAPDGLSFYGRDPVWSPDGRYITIADRTYGYLSGHRTSTEKDLIGFAGGYSYRIEQNKLLRTALGSYLTDTVFSFKDKGYSFTGFRVSSDGRWFTGFAGVSEMQRKMIAVDLRHGAKEKTLVGGLFYHDTYNTGVPFAHYAISPDSKYVYIGYKGKIHRIALESGEDKIIPFTAQVREELGPRVYHTFRVSQEPFKTKYVRSANRSPDGRQIVYSAMNTVYIKDLPGGVPRQLVKQAVSQYQPVYSPDGRWVAYVTWQDQTGGALWKVAAKGGQPIQLSKTPGQYQRPAWSPDGRLIVVVRGRPELGDRDDWGKGDLLLIDAASGQEKTLDKNLPLWNMLCFSGDGSSVVYTPLRSVFERKPQVVMASVSLRDTAKKAIATGSTDGLGMFFKQASVSPDGRYAVYTLGEDLYLVPVNKAADTLALYDEKKSVQTVRFALGIDPHWEGPGHELAWNYINTYYRVDAAKVIKAAETHSFKNGTIAVDVKPDEAVDLGLTVQASYGKGTIVLLHPRVITMQGNKVIEDAAVVIQDGRFLSVGTARQTHIPKGAKVMELKGTTLMPGLIDLHDHIRLACDVFPEQSWQYLADLAYGVTTARDPSSSYDSFGYAELLKAGQMTGPRLFTVGQSIGPGYDTWVNSLQDAERFALKRKLIGGTVIKQYTSPTRRQRQWVLMGCAKAGINMTNEGAHDPIEQLGMIKDGSTGVEHNPEWGDVFEDYAQMWGASKTTLTPTLQVAYGTTAGWYYFRPHFWSQPDAKLRRFWPEQELTNMLKDTASYTQDGFLSAAKIDCQFWKAGGQLVMGSHGDDAAIGAHNELWALQMGGLSNLEALKIATFSGAKAMGIQQDLGSIEPGKIADLIILNKNPLEDIHNSREIRYVMKDGILYDGNTLDTIWPFRRKCPDWRMAVQEPVAARMRPAGDDHD